jgi:protein-tyrosine phosphatase
MNKKRSATAEQIYRNDARLEVRSAGVRQQANRRVSEADLLWADVVFVMENEHKKWIGERYKHLDLPSIDVLHIPDEFEFMDAELVEMLRLMLDPEIEHLVGAKYLT